MENKEISLLKLLLSGEVFTEDDIMENMNINNNELENLFQKLEDLNYLEVDNSYFEKTCDNCSKESSCISPTYIPNERVRKIRVLTWKAIEEFGEKD
jgi:hypothetical protein